MIELLSLPKIIGMAPLLLFIIFAFTGKKQIVSVVLATILAIILGGVSLVDYAGMLSKSLASFLGLIGLIIMLGSGLGKVLEVSGVSHTIVHAIVKTIGVKTENRAILATTIASVVVCGLFGTLGGGTAIIAPIIIPIMASAGLSKSTVGAIFQSAGETGLIWGPLSPPVIALLGITGITFCRMMLYAALPFGIIWLVVLFFAAKRIQKNTKDWDKYDDITYNEQFVPTKANIRNAIIFAMAFVGLVVYGFVAKQEVVYVPFVMIALILIVGISSKISVDKIFGITAEGMSKTLPLFLLFLMFNPIFTMMMKMGAFDALAGLFTGLLNGSGKSQTLLMIIGSLVGSFGIEGAAVVQMQITHKLFAQTIAAVGLPMEMWAIALIAASRITSSIYPTANMVGCMGIARSENIKAMLFAGWSVSIVSLVYIFIWSFIGPSFF